MITFEQFIKDYNLYCERRSAILVKIVSSKHNRDKTEYNSTLKELEDINNECEELCLKYYDE
jgi:hypothetical protein